MQDATPNSTPAPSNLLTIHLDDMAPKLIDEADWRVLLDTPSTGLTLTVRTYGEFGVLGPACWEAAVVYGSKGVSGLNTEGAGHYAGELLKGPTVDDIAAAVFRIGYAIGLSRPQCWALVRQLPTTALVLE